MPCRGLQCIHLFAAAILFTTSSVALDASAQTAAIPSAPAGGIDPAKLPEILGIHLGMTSDIVIPKMKALYPGSQITIQNFQYMNTPAPKWTGYVTTGSGQTKCGTAVKPLCNAYEQLNATFSGPPNKSVLVGLEWIVSYGVGGQPTVDSVKAGLFQKYGANPAFSNGGNYIWVTNEEGGPLTLAVPAKNLMLLGCGNTLLAPIVSIRTYTPSGQPLTALDMKQWMTMRCNSLGVYAKATIGINASTPLAISLNVRITDTAEDMRDALAGEKYIESVHAATAK